MNTVLFGMQGCGKTTLGQSIARRLKCSFIDTDLLIEHLYQLKRKRSLDCREIYQEIGAVAFRFLEFETIQSLQDVQKSVIAVGGGVMMSPDNIDILKKTGCLVYIIEAKEVIKSRLLSGTTLPAYLDPQDPDTSFDQVYEERNEYYNRLSPALTINLSQITHQAAITKICQFIRQATKRIAT